MKVIHFITLDEKHITEMIHFFEDIEEMNNRFIYFQNNKNDTSLIHTSNKYEVINISQIIEIISNPFSCDIIVIHSLLSLPCNIIKLIDKKIKVVWFSWGFDTYSNKFPQFPLIKLKNRIKPKTINLRYRIRLLHENFRTIVKELHKNSLKERKHFIDAIKRIAKSFNRRNIERKTSYLIKKISKLKKNSSSTITSNGSNPRLNIRNTYDIDKNMSTTYDKLNNSS